jgi:hypothetical protein
MGQMKIAKGGDYLGELGVEGRIKLKWILTNQNVSRMHTHDSGRGQVLGLVNIISLRAP